MGKAKLKKIKYYDLRKNWRKVKRHLDNPRVASTLVRDFNKFAYGRWRRRFTASRYPCEFESCDWAVCHACKLGLEGIVSKRLGSSYRFRPLAALDQKQKSGGTGSQARGRGGLGALMLVSDFPIEADGRADTLEGVGPTQNSRSPCHCAKGPDRRYR